MKASSRIRTALRNAMREHDTAERRQRYLAGDFANADRVVDLDRRYRFDLYWFVQPTLSRDIRDEIGWLLGTHLYTALKSIIEPVTVGVVIVAPETSVTFVLVDKATDTEILRDQTTAGLLSAHATVKSIMFNALAMSGGIRWVHPTTGQHYPRGIAWHVEFVDPDTGETLSAVPS